VDYSIKSKEELIEEINFLKKKENIISKVLDDTNEIIYHVSYNKKEEKHFEYVSPHVERVMGITTETYIDANYKNKILEYFHPEDVKNLIEKAKSISKKERKHTFKYRFFNNKKKRYIWIEETIVASYRKNGEKAAIFGTAKDITEEVEKEKQLSFILENIDECLYNVKFTPKGKVLGFVSPSIKRMTGLTIKEFHKEGQSGKLIKRIHPDDVSKINKNIKKGLYKKKLKSINSIFRLKPKGSKKYIWIEETLNANYDKNGKLLETTTVLRDITNQKIIEKHLKENEEKYRKLFTKNLAGVFITENSKIIDCNNSFAKIFGYKSRVELIGKDVSILYFSKKDRENYIKDLKEKRFLTNYRLRCKNKKGGEAWVYSNTSLTNKNRIEGTLVGISDQINAEEKLKKSEKNYKELSENSPYGVFVHIDGKIIYANKEAYKIWGLKEKKKLNIYDFILPENKKEGDKRSEQALLGKEVPFKEFKIKKPFTNKTIYVEAKPMFFEVEGKKAIQVVFNDITLEKELNKEKIRATIAEESNKILQKEIKERNKVEKKLIENQKYTNSIINSSLDIICASDKNGEIIEFNSAAEQAFGYKEEEVKEKGVQLIYASKKDYLKVSKQLNRTGYYIGEVENKRKNKEVFTSFLSASVLYNEEGEQIGTMGVSRDVTELKEAELQLIESEEKYRDLFENATDLIQSIDMKGNIVYVNEAWKKTTGYSDKELENKNIFEIIHPDCKKKCEAIFEEIGKSKKGKGHEISFELKTKNGEKIIVEGGVSLKFKEGKPESTRAILRNITGETWEKTKQTVYNNIAKIVTEKSDADETYEAIREELGKVLKTDIFIISYLLENETLTFPYYFEGKKGRVEKEDRKKGNGINEYFLKQRKPKLLTRKELDKIIGGGSYQLLGQKCLSFIGVPLKIKNKTVGVLSVQSYTNENEFNQKSVEILDFISGALALAVQRKVDENKIFEQSARLKSIIESGSHMFWTYDKNKGITSFNKSFSDEIFKAYGKRPILGGKKQEANRILKKDEDQDFWDKQYKEAFTGKTVEFATEKVTKKGERIVKSVVLNPIFDEEKKVTELSGISRDITDKTIAEEGLKESLKEKEILLKEVHHRVKNNLQVISSILNLQSSYVKDKKTLSILKESQNRIKSMAFIHESLYQTNDFSKINFSEYVVSLSKNLVHSYGIYGDLIDLKFNIKEIYLSLDLSIPSGLIINELVSNALKYAFKEKEKGTININLFEKNDNVNLIVQDNGLGLPNEINYRDTDSLGLQLVMTLVEQVGGEISLDNKRGAKYTIIFKKE
jgi:PAS domain S-box-containing protein